MATKRFIVEVEEGCTFCDDCPIRIRFNIHCFMSKIEGGLSLNCNKYNLTTMKIKELEEEK